MPACADGAVSLLRTYVEIQIAISDGFSFLKISVHIFTHSLSDTTKINKSFKMSIEAALMVTGYAVYLFFKPMFKRLGDLCCDYLGQRWVASKRGCAGMPAPLGLSGSFTHLLSRY